MTDKSNMTWCLHGPVPQTKSIRMATIYPSIMNGKEEEIVHLMNEKNLEILGVKNKNKDYMKIKTSREV